MGGKWRGQSTYNQHYAKEHYDRIILNVPKGMKNQWQEAAKIRETSLTQYVKYCIEKDMYG